MRDHILEVDKNGDTVDYWDLNTILDPFRDNVLPELKVHSNCPTMLGYRSFIIDPTVMFKK